MYTQQTNKVAMRSQRMIAEAFLELLSRQSYDEITVTEICKHADIVRKTFYRNFQSKQDIISYHIDMLFSQFSQKTDLTSQDPFDAVLVLFDFLTGHKAMISSLIQNNLLYIVNRKIKEYILGTIFIARLKPEFQHAAYHKYLISHLSAIICNFVEIWADDGYTDAPDMLAGLAARLIRPILQ